MRSGRPIVKGSKLSPADSGTTQQTARLYRERTPAMAAGLADHIWGVEEFLLFPVG